MNKMIQEIICKLHEISHTKYFINSGFKVSFKLYIKFAYRPILSTILCQGILEI